MTRFWVSNQRFKLVVTTDENDVVLNCSPVDDLAYLVFIGHPIQYLLEWMAKFGQTEMMEI